MVSDIGLFAAWRKMKQCCIAQDQSIISAYTSSYCDRCLNLFLFQVLKLQAQEAEEASNKPLYLTMLVPGRNYSEVNTVPLEGTPYSCYNIQQRSMAAN